MAEYQAGSSTGPDRFRSGGDKPLPYDCFVLIVFVGEGLSPPKDHSEISGTAMHS